MTTTEALKEIMARQGLSSSAVAKRMGANVPQRLVTDRIAMKNISVSKLNDLLRVLDYQIVLVPNTERRKDSWFVIDDDGLAPKAEGETK